MTNLDELQVAEGSNVEVWSVLMSGDAVVELAVAAADGEGLGAVCSAQRCRSVQPAEVGWRAKFCARTQKKCYGQVSLAVKTQISGGARCSAGSNGA